MTVEAARLGLYRQCTGGSGGGERLILTLRAMPGDCQSEGERSGLDPCPRVRRQGAALGREDSGRWFGPYPQKRF